MNDAIGRAVDLDSGTRRRGALPCDQLALNATPAGLELAAQVDEDRIVARGCSLALGGCLGAQRGARRLL